MLWYRWFGLEECSVGTRGKLARTALILVTEPVLLETYPNTPASLLASSLWSANWRIVGL